jgi:hypothetical protein
MVDTEPNMFDIPGKGFMVHPMWMYHGEEWNDIREKSYNFGWENYNPSKHN